MNVHPDTHTCIYIHTPSLKGTHARTHARTHTHTHKHAHKHAHTHARAHIHTKAHIRALEHAHAHTCTHTHTHLHVTAVPEELGEASMASAAASVVMLGFLSCCINYTILSTIPCSPTLVRVLSTYHNYHNMCCTFELSFLVKSPSLGCEPLALSTSHHASHRPPQAHPGHPTG